MPSSSVLFCAGVPEMKYDAQGETARGELLLRGSNNFSGYFKQQDKTVRRRRSRRRWLAVLDGPAHQWL
jgi:hypothetical protein